MSRAIEPLTRNGLPGHHQAEGQADASAGSRLRLAEPDGRAALPGDPPEETPVNIALGDRARHAFTPLLYSAKDLAQVLNVSVETIWRLRAKGKLPRAFELSTQTLRWRVEEIDRWVRAGMPDLETWAMAAK